MSSVLKNNRLRSELRFIVSTFKPVFSEVEKISSLVYAFCSLYSVFHRFGQAKFACDGSILGSNRFLLLLCNYYTKMSTQNMNINLINSL
jgi:hypothetical protein